jgi:ABC-2 type transport system permease protein/lipopolysaccharide transport system permease protein
MVKIEKAQWQYWIYASWFKIAVRYRKTILGPLWLIAGPAVMVGMLGFLFATIANIDIRVFTPHLALGIVIWSLISAFVNSGTTVIFHNRPKIIHSAMKLIDIVMVNIFTALLQFLHHVTIIVATYLIFPWDITPYAFVSLIGLILLIINGVWYAIVFGILGVRFRDISEVVSTIMGAMFFVTPILWMAGSDGRGGILGP